MDQIKEDENLQKVKFTQRGKILRLRRVVATPGICWKSSLIAIWEGEAHWRISYEWYIFR